MNKLMAKWIRGNVAVRPGLYHFMREADGAVARFHLRVDSTGDGLLLANAAAMARLSASGVVIAKGLLDGDSLPAIVRRLKRSFRGTSGEQIDADIAAVKDLIERMKSPGESYPILNLADPAFSPKNMPLERPISADVPLCDLSNIHRILDRLWQMGILHATFVAGRKPDDMHLVRAVERAEDLGLITGVRGRGSDLCHRTLIKDTAVAGLDHLDVYCLSAVDAVHDALAGPGDCIQSLRALSMAKENEVCAAAQMALVQPTLATIDQTLKALVERGIKNVCVFAVVTSDAGCASSGAILAHELPPAVRWVEESAEGLGLRLMWQPAVPFDPARPLGEQVCLGPRCNGDSGVRIEPDGSVIPARGPHVAAGNLFKDDWETIENSRVFQDYRRRLEKDEV